MTLFKVEQNTKEHLPRWLRESLFNKTDDDETLQLTTPPQQVRDPPHLSSPVHAYTMVSSPQSIARGSSPAKDERKLGNELVEKDFSIRWQRVSKSEDTDTIVLDAPIVATPECALRFGSKNKNTTNSSTSVLAKDSETIRKSSTANPQVPQAVGVGCTFVGVPAASVLNHARRIFGSESASLHMSDTNTPHTIIEGPDSLPKLPQPLVRGAAHSISPMNALEPITRTRTPQSPEQRFLEVLNLLDSKSTVFYTSLESFCQDWFTVRSMFLQHLLYTNGSNTRCHV